jgi:hypothetical protein
MTRRGTQAPAGKTTGKFEDWIIEQAGGQGHHKKGSDRGTDGRMADGAPAQVKRQDAVGVNVVKNFVVSAEQYDKAAFERRRAAGESVGTIIAFSFGKGAVQEAARQKMENGVTLTLKRVDEIVPVATRPRLSVEIAAGDAPRNMTLTATGESAAGVEFYAWDFEYDEKKGFRPGVLLDKTGRQEREFSAGPHIIACKVTDGEGLEATATARFTVAG